MNNKIHRLLKLLESAFSQENKAGAQSAVSALQNAQKTDITLISYANAPVKLIDCAAGQSGSLPVSGMIKDCCEYFNWENWAQGVLKNEVSSKLFTTELVGPEGLFDDANVRIGLLVSDKNNDYPVSSHSGEETYYVISGIAHWTINDGPYLPFMPGSLVHHPAWVPHGRRTTDEVFLGAWRWSGDLDLRSFQIQKK